MGTESAQLLRLEPLLQKIIAKRLAAWPEYIHDDVAGVARVRLWKALPSYDATRGELGAFARVVIVNAIKDELDRIRSERRRLTLLDDDHPHHDADAESAALANAFRENPSAYLPPCLVRVLTALQSHDSPGAAARSLNMRPESFYTLSSRLKRRIKTIFDSDRSRFSTPARKAA
ncbi:MAG: hypothetical protein IAG10_19535 [Planctomycetaceae bacterium]|nr:hypothetical protein [Planctomycetaceae bacterium]